MSYTLAFWPDADEALTELEAAAGTEAALAAVRRILGRLEADPFDPKLATRQFVTEGYGHIRMTPCRHESSHVYWTIGAQARVLEIVFIGNATVEAS